MPPRTRAEPEQQWPPRSPHEALLSTPSGRERLRRLAERASPSPSPSKRASRPAGARGEHYNPRESNGDDDDMDLDIEGDEDEETLELKLAAIQAKLRLKRLQAARAKRTQEPDIQSRPRSDSAPLGRTQSRIGGLKPEPVVRPESQAEIQVPASPVRRTQPAQEITSPSRVRLGIDKGLRAKDVSLKRAPSLKKGPDADGGPRAAYLRKAATPGLGMADRPAVQDRPKTFSERLAASRVDEKTRQERKEKIQQVRTKAFQLGKQELEELKQNATEIPDIPMQEEQYSRDEVMAGNILKRNSTMPKSLSQASNDRRPSSGQEMLEPQLQGAAYITNKPLPPSEVPEEETSAFEPYSSIHLKKRIIPHVTLTRNLTGKTTYTIPDLLKDVKAPEFQLPDIEQDIVIFGILASKSEPRAHKDTSSSVKEKTEAGPMKAKYMVMKLVDLKWELDLFLFNTGFERYWKLTPGTLIAILNPTIMPPPSNRTDTGKFSLVINSGQDTILEVGTARDLGFCKSVKKDGALCSSWVNSKRTEFCEYHMNMALSKKTLARQDVNAFNTGLGPKKQGSRRFYGRDEHASDVGKKQRGGYDRESQGTWFLHKASAASMLDNEILGGRVTSTIERSEALRRRLATEEKERHLMKKLGEVGNGAGKEYMSTSQRPTKSGSVNRLGSSFGSTSTTEEPRVQLDAKSLGLVADKSNKIHLSPVKRKRGESSLPSRSASVLGYTASSFSAPRTEALGWGGGLKNKLARMKEGERFGRATGATSSSSQEEAPGDATKDRQRSPARKKTRFITEKGIREAGRDSLGGELMSGSGRVGERPRMVLLDDDDDDDLVILK
ncbi:putative minichromosome maintenance protein 10 [Rosellinia necatrix]|uniref:Putative minichromosome maintenance protein 10 n=1 Tax=Rosellinia necatrix TaxID=77044 RepID=A0A1W2TRW3_ROSNE|nr:putative minichromosome maintenance protein 10 [Rosellinia necatrix]